MEQKEHITMEYDAICYKTFANVLTLSKNCDKICFINFDPKNKEHLFILANTMACWGILGEKDIALDCGFFARLKFAWKYRKVCNIKKINKKERENAINVPEVLEYMRGPACESCGPSFRFGDIYDAFYNEKGQA